MSDDKTRIYGDNKIPNGAIILGTYAIERFLHSGGMAWTYLATHKELHTKHVIKVIKPGFEAEGIDVIDLFKREAQALRSIRHDAVVSYDGFHNDETYGFCLVMEYIEGPSLKELLSQRPLTLDEVWQLRDRIAEGLAAAHAKGIFHRDLAPDNIIIPNGDVKEAKIIDFGIAKQSDASQRTILGSSYAGKITYVAPEQFGLYDGTIGPFTDIYSLGLILAGALRGKPLDMGSTMETGYQARLKTPDLSSIPDAFRPQLMAMLQPNPANRPQNIAELLNRWPCKSKYKKDEKLSKRFFSKNFLSIAVVSLAILTISIIVITKIMPVNLIEKDKIISGKEKQSASNEKKEIQTGFLSITTVPEAALVLLKDKTFIGITPLKTDLPAGAYNLIIKKKGFLDEESQIEIRQENETNIDIELKQSS